MAANVSGYAFAYQLYGSLCYENRNKIGNRKTQEEYEDKLGEVVYEQIWSELSTKDRKLLSAIAEYGEKSVKNSDLMAKFEVMYPEEKINEKLMTLYKTRLKRTGVITIDRFGYSKIALPCLSKYVKEYGVIEE